MTRFRLIIGAIVLAAIAYSAVWFTVAFEARDSLKARLAQWRDGGATARTDQLDLSGFPYRIRLELKNVRLESPQGGARFESERVRLITHVWTPGHWVAQATNTRLGAFGDTVRLEDRSLRASLRRQGGYRVMVMDSGLENDARLTRFPGLSRPVALTDGTLFLRLPDPEGAEEGGADQGNDLFADRIADFKLVAAWNGGRVDTLGRLSGAGPLAWSQKALARWRDSGGLMELDTLTLRLGEGQITGNGSLSLDRAFRPLGTLSLDYSGGEALNAALGPLVDGPPAPVPGDSEGSLSVMLQNGQVMVGDRRLVTIPPLL